MLYWWLQLPKTVRWWLYIGISFSAMIVIVVLDKLGITVPTWVCLLALLIAAVGTGMAYAVLTEA